MNRLNGTAALARILPRLQAILKWVGFAVLVYAQYSALAQWTEPVLMRPPINVDPPGSYYYSTISADGQVLCMTIFPGQYGDDDVYISERIDDSTWTTPVNAGPNVNNEARNLSPSITSDRQRLYYVKWTGASYDFFVSHRTGPDWDDWSPGESLPEPINRGIEFTGQISFDDSTLVFTSSGQPGPLHGIEAMYESRLQGNSGWSEPVPLAPHLNHWNGSYHPCLTDSGTTLVYSMFGGPSLHFDIFFASRNDTGFGIATRCDSTINSPYWDSNPSAPTNGSFVIFESLRTNQGGAPHQLFIANRQTQSTRQRGNLLDIPRIGVSPTLGSPGSSFEIQLPYGARGKDIHIYDICGREVDLIRARSNVQTHYTWKGLGNGGSMLPSGSYFLAVNYTIPVAKITILK